VAAPDAESAPPPPQPAVNPSPGPPDPQTAFNPEPRPKPEPGPKRRAPGSRQILSASPTQEGAKRTRSGRPKAEAPAEREVAPGVDPEPQAESNPESHPKTEPAPNPGPAPNPNPKRRAPGSRQILSASPTQEGAKRTRSRPARDPGRAREPDPAAKPARAPEPAPAAPAAPAAPEAEHTPEAEHAAEAGSNPEPEPRPTTGARTERGLGAVLQKRLGPEAALPPGTEGAWAPSPRAALLALLVLIVTATALGLTRGSTEPAVSQAVSAVSTADPTPQPRPAGTGPVTATDPYPEPFHAAQVNVNTTGFWSWALLDRRTGRIVGSANLAEASTPASMIKAWLAADFLSRADRKSVSRRMLDLIEIMIRDSDNDAAARIFELNGKTASIVRLINVCRLTDTTPVANEYGTTRISARDSVRMGQCIASGRAAGPTWTPWLLEQMRGVRGEGDFGIREAFPADQAARIAIKNGWLLRDEDLHWHVACLAIGSTWVMAVMQRFPSSGVYERDFAHTRSVCRDVATQLLAPG
jgi:hypothetical protein